jgi:hypothetical protein
MQTQQWKRAPKESRIFEHVEKLLVIFPSAQAFVDANGKHFRGKIALYKRLHRIEAEAHSFSERCCNEDISDSKAECKDLSILKRLDEILGFNALGIKVFVNGDPRGYALKIDDACMRAKSLELYTDMGGYGILCPDF